MALVDGNGKQITPKPVQGPPIVDLGAPPEVLWKQLFARAQFIEATAASTMQKLSSKTAWDAETIDATLGMLGAILQNQALVVALLANSVRSQASRVARVVAMPGGKPPWQQ